MNNPKYLVAHSTDVSRDKASRQFFAVNRYHRDVKKFPISSLGWHGGYHFFYEPDGTELRYREDWEIGAHNNAVVDGTSINLQSIGLAWAGDGDIEFPTEAQTFAMKRRLTKLQKKYDIPIDRVRIAPHRAWRPSKTCYGSLLSDDYAVNLVRRPEKPAEQLEKQKQITNLQKQIADLLNQIILLLKIKIGIWNKRKKNSPR